MDLFSGLMGNACVVSPEELSRDYGKLIAEGEVIELGFKLVRDVFIFTNKRLILVDYQGMTGKKVEYHSIAYKSITHFSIETAGHFDLDTELKLWISSSKEPITKKINKKVNIYDLQKVLATHILN